MARCPTSLSISVWTAAYPFCLVPFFPDPLCLSVSLLLSPSWCRSLLPTSAVSLAHICPLDVLYHLVRLGLSLFLSRPPASCVTPYPAPPSLCPSACCQNSLHQSQMLSPLEHVPIHPSLSLLSSSLPPLSCLPLPISLYSARPFPLIIQPVLPSYLTDHLLYHHFASHLFSLNSCMSAHIITAAPVKSSKVTCSGALLDLALSLLDQKSARNQQSSVSNRYLWGYGKCSILVWQPHFAGEKEFCVTCVGYFTSNKTSPVIHIPTIYTPTLNGWSIPIPPPESLHRWSKCWRNS